MSAVKSLYLKSLTASRRAAAASGLLDFLERHRGARTALWMRSIFAIYDLDDMVHLDLPWWTFNAIDRVEDFLKRRPGASVFEYGSGSSTIWLAKRSSQVISVEHDPEWSKRMDRHIMPFKNIDLRTIRAEDSAQPLYPSEKAGWKNREFQAYVREIVREGLFDLIIIDGRARAACLQAALPHLKAGGMIVFDDSYRKRYQPALASCPMPRHDASGLSPGLPYPSVTTLFGS